MALSGILIDAGNVRPRWLEVGVPLIAVDTLVHLSAPNRYLEPAQSRPFVRPRLLPARRLRRYHSSGRQADRCSAVQPDFSAGISAGRSPRPEQLPQQSRFNLSRLASCTVPALVTEAADWRGRSNFGTENATMSVKRNTNDACYPAQAALIYAKTVEGKISSAVMASTGIDSSDSNEVSQFEQYHR
jgi:hypothetical protein